jgi:hypothetical protein
MLSLAACQRGGRWQLVEYREGWRMGRSHSRKCAMAAVVRREDGTCTEASGSGMPFRAQQQLCGGYFEVGLFMLLPMLGGCRDSSR